MKSMIETLESRTLLSAAPSGALFAQMQTQMSVMVPAVMYTSPIARYVGSHTSNQGGGPQGFTIVVQQWNVAAGTMQIKIINADGSIQNGLVGTISGASHRAFTLQFPSDTNKITTITGKVNSTFTTLTGTYVTKNLKGVQKDSGTFSASR